MGLFGDKLKSERVWCCISERNQQYLLSVVYSNTYPISGIRKYLVNSRQKTGIVAKGEETINNLYF